MILCRKTAQASTTSVPACAVIFQKRARICAIDRLCAVCYHSKMTSLNHADGTSLRREIFNKIRPYIFNRYVGFLAALFAYQYFVQLLGGVRLGHEVFFIEIPLVLLSYAYFNHILRRNRWQAFLAAVPVFGVYVAHDAFSFAFDTPMRLAHTQELPLLLKFLPPRQLVVLGALALVPALIAFYNVDWRARFKSILAGAAALTLLAVTLKLAPGVLIIRQNGVPVADIKSRFGRIATALSTDAQCRVTANALPVCLTDIGYRQEKRELAELVARHNNGHSVHLVAMESLLDPTLFANVKLSSDPYSPEFKKLFAGQGGFSVTPVLGGGTAQPEFELLCGAPALKKVDSIEFKRFTGKQASCLPALLGRAGYRTMAAQLIPPEIFNEAVAYKSLGFAESYFPKEFYDGKTYVSLAKQSKNEFTVFDGDFFDANLAFLNGYNKPVFNYLCALYGHYPYTLDETLRPRILSITPKNADLEKIANQFFYRTKAMADYAEALNKRESHSLIIFVGDHLPLFNAGSALPLVSFNDGGVSFGTSRDQYAKLGYLPNMEKPTRTTRLFILRDGKPVVYPLIHHYDIPAIVLDYVTDGAYCKKYSCAHLGHAADVKTLERRYLQIMAEGSVQ